MLVSNVFLSSFGAVQLPREQILAVSEVLTSMKQQAIPCTSVFHHGLNQPHTTQFNKVHLVDFTRKKGWLSTECSLTNLSNNLLINSQQQPWKVNDLSMLLH
jgi:hypothetical protein